MNVSFEALLQRLVQKGNELAKSTPIDTDNRPTSIRLKQSTKHFLECQAEAMSTSVQSVISMILDGVAESTIDSNASTIRTIRERFFYIFQQHDINFPTIVSILKEHGFSLSTLDNPTRLLDLLDQKCIHFLANTFHIKPEWVGGSTDQLTDLGIDVYWYKNVPTIAAKLTRYINEGLEPHIIFIRRKDAEFENARIDNDKGRVQEEPIGAVIHLSHTTFDGVNYETYELLDFERWNYRPCRNHMKFLISFCDETQGIRLSGQELSLNAIKALISGNTFPVSILKSESFKRWYPDDYASVVHTVKEEASEWTEIKGDYYELGISHRISTAKNK